MGRNMSQPLKIVDGERLRFYAMKYSWNMLLEALREMSSSELKELSSAIQEAFSVKVEDPPKPEYHDFWQYYYLGGYDVVLNDAGSNKLKVIKELYRFKEISLAEAREIVLHHLPVKIAEGFSSRNEANEIKRRFEALGADVSLKGGFIYDPLPDGYSHD